MGPEGGTPLAPRRLHRPAHAGGDLLRQQPQRIGPGLRRSGSIGDYQLSRGSGVAPGPQVELEEVGGHQGQPPASHLHHGHGNAHDAQQDGDTQPELRGAEGEVAVGAVGHGAHRHHRHDLGEGEPQQHLVLGLHVGRNFMLSHSVPSYTSALPLPGWMLVVGSGRTGVTFGSTTAFTTSSTTP